MRMLAVDWNAIGSVATGLAAIAAFLGILPSVLVYRSQDRRDRAATVRQRIQFVTAQKDRVLESIQLSLPAIIDCQMRDFKATLGSDVTPAYFLEQLFENHPLFLASAMNSTLSSAPYNRMNDLWDQIDEKATEFRGALRIFSHACALLTYEPYRLCIPDFSSNILDAIKMSGDLMKTLESSDHLDTLTNTLRTYQVTVATKIFLAGSNDKLKESISFIGQLSEATLNLSDRALLKLAHKTVPSLGETTSGLDTIEQSLPYLAPELPGPEIEQLQRTVSKWKAVSAADYRQRQLEPRQEVSSVPGAQPPVSPASRPADPATPIT